MAFIELDLRSGYLNSHEEVWMILPDEKPPKDGYPVLWLFHGAHQDCSEWVRNSSVERFANERGLAVIMPTMLHSYGMDMKYGADYFSMVTRELWPELHWMFPCLSQKKEKNFVAGASMGGYIAYKWALTCPEQFAKAGALRARSTLCRCCTNISEKESRILDIIWRTPLVRRRQSSIQRMICFGWQQNSRKQESFFRNAGWYAERRTLGTNFVRQPVSD